MSLMLQTSILPSCHVGTPCPGHVGGSERTKTNTHTVCLCVLGKSKVVCAKHINTQVRILGIYLLF